MISTHIARNAVYFVCTTLMMFASFVPRSWCLRYIPITAVDVLDHFRRQHDRMLMLRGRPLHLQSPWAPAAQILEEKRNDLEEPQTRATPLSSLEGQACHNADALRSQSGGWIYTIAPYAWQDCQHLEGARQTHYCYYPQMHCYCYLMRWPQQESCQCVARGLCSLMVGDQ